MLLKKIVILSLIDMQKTVTAFSVVKELSPLLLNNRFCRVNIFLKRYARVIKGDNTEAIDVYVIGNV